MVARELARMRGQLQKTRPDEGGKVSWELITTRVNSISLPERLTVCDQVFTLTCLECN